MSESQKKKDILLEWTPEMSVEIGVIDEEHKRLIAYINALYDGIGQGFAHEALGKILDQLAFYAIAHFQHEESFFAQLDYPEAAEHIKEHDWFREKINTFVKRYAAENTTVLTLELMGLLKNWIVHHIQDVDKRYTTYFHSKGVY